MNYEFRGLLSAAKNLVGAGEALRHSAQQAPVVSIRRRPYGF